MRYHRNLDADRAALIGMYHDASEIITGDMPTPVKYANSEIRDAYHQVEARAEKTILSTLPEDLQDAYAQVLTHSAEASESEAYLRKLIKAADKIAALIKCIEEAQSGNSEVITAEASTRGVVEDLADSLPEVRDFMTEFLPSYGETLDQLL